MKDIRKELIAIAKRWETLTGNRRTTAASLAVRDARFLDTVENGGNFTIYRYEKMRKWFLSKIKAADTKDKE